MLWILFFILSVIILFVSLAAVFIPGFCHKVKSSVPLSSILFAGVFIAICFCIYPSYYELQSESTFAPLRAIIFSIIQTIQVFTVNANADYILAIANSSFIPAQSAYTLYLTVLSVVAPILTFSLIINLLISLIDGLRFIAGFSKEIYAFSEINEKSICLAKDINEHNKSALIVFSASDNASEDQINECKSIKAILFKKDLLSVNLELHSKASHFNLFVFGEDESDNVSLSLRLIEKYTGKDNVSMYVLTSEASGELLLSCADKGKIKLRRVNEVRSTVYRFLYDQGETLFKKSIPDKDNIKQINAAVLGLDSFGTEMFKALTWFCQMDGYMLNLHLFDNNPAAEEIIKGEYPELLSDKINGGKVEGESRYYISVHSGTEFRSSEFYKQLSSVGTLTFVFISLGDDNLNISCSSQVRLLSERMSYSPNIVTVIRDSYLSKALTNARNYKKQPYNISVIGTNEELYSEKIVLESELETSALDRHKKYGGSEDDFWGFEYNYRSSLALVLANKARSVCGYSFMNKSELELSEIEKEQLESLEHRRWNAYMRSEGYVFSGSTEKSTRNDLGKMHHDLVPYSNLSALEKAKDSAVSTK